MPEPWLAPMESDMSANLSNKKIIMIHGLAAKPTPEITHELWRRTLIENIRVGKVFQLEVGLCKVRVIA